MFDGGLSFPLGEEIDVLRDTVRRFAAEKIAPRAAEIDRDNTSRATCGRSSARWACSASRPRRATAAPAWAISPTASRWRRSAAPRPRSACPTARTPISASTRSRRNGTEEQKRSYLPKLISRRACRRAGDERDRRGLRRGRHARCAPTGRATHYRPERHQDVDHQRPRRRCPHRLRQDRPGGRRARHHRLPGREGLQGLLAPRRSSTSSACAARTPASWSSRIARCRRRTCWARSQRASRC